MLAVGNGGGNTAVRHKNIEGRGDFLERREGMLENIAAYDLDREHDADDDEANGGKMGLPLIQPIFPIFLFFHFFAPYLFLKTADPLCRLFDGSAALIVLTETY